MAGVADEVEAALAAAHLDELGEREDDFQAHDAGVSLDDLDAVKEAIRKQVRACNGVFYTYSSLPPCRPVLWASTDHHASLANNRPAAL
jgi:hypothetical protein